ncbi:MAG: hypothetical protein H6834_13070 [Planctomycetes bacterium]|nr:hypothetical protein [Planctomycetota bacterium]
MTTSGFSVRGEAAKLLHGFPKRRPSERLDRYGHLPPNDRSLLREIVLGSIRRRSTLDAVAAAFTKHVEQPVAPFLHVGLYQLLFLDRVPAFAAIAETLKAAEERLGRKRRAFLNAVLRRVAEACGAVTEACEDASDSIQRGDGRSLAFGRAVFPDPTSDFVAYAAAQYGLPVDLVQRWVHRHGRDGATSLFRESIRPPRIHFRRLPGAPPLADLVAQLTASGLTLELDPLTDGFRTDQVGAILTSAVFADGHLIVQGEAASRSIDALRVDEGARVIDLCAAPGGKAAVLARRVGPSGSLLLCDRDANRLSLLRQTLERTRPACSIRILELPRERSGLDGFEPTHIVIDAPCTNTGVLSRRVEARWAFQSRRIPEALDRQKDLLELAVSLAGPETKLLYGTCSLEPEENRGILEAGVLDQGFSIEEEHWFLPNGGSDGGYVARLGRVDHSVVGA